MTTVANNMLSKSLSQYISSAEDLIAEAFELQT